MREVWGKGCKKGVKNSRAWRGRKTNDGLGIGKHIGTRWTRAWNGKAGSKGGEVNDAALSKIRQQTDKYEHDKTRLWTTWHPRIANVFFDVGPRVPKKGKPLDNCCFRFFTFRRRRFAPPLPRSCHVPDDGPQQRHHFPPRSNLLSLPFFLFP